MSDTEVESILREIREQVYAQRAAHDGEVSASELNRAIVQNGAYTPEVTLQVDRLRAHTPILARSWDRLPPIISNRRGLAAKLELWVKSKARVLMRWFTWEQVNFNAAVHQSVLETIAQLENIDHQLQSVREQLKQTRATEASLDEQNRLLNERLDKLDEFRNATEYQLALAEQQAESIERRITKLEESLEATKAEESTQIRELRDAHERLTQEQRVCFKQLSLESSETAAIIDRTRRKLEERLAELNQQPINPKVERSSTKAGSQQK